MTRAKEIHDALYDATCPEFGGDQIECPDCRTKAIEKALAEGYRAGLEEAASLDVVAWFTGAAEFSMDGTSSAHQDRIRALKDPRS